MNDTVTVCGESSLNGCSWSWWCVIVTTCYNWTRSFSLINQPLASYQHPKQCYHQSIRVQFNTGQIWLADAKLWLVTGIAASFPWFWLNYILTSRCDVTGIIVKYIYTFNMGNYSTMGSFQVSELLLARNDSILRLFCWLKHVEIISLHSIGFLVPVLLTQKPWFLRLSENISKVEVWLKYIAKLTSYIQWYPMFLCATPSLTHHIHFVIQLSQNVPIFYGINVPILAGEILLCCQNPPA